ncbi:Tlg2-vesicle protein [Arthrobotrys musiformis]|uniref:Golgi apparatus membrane protein TVP38 n=1 Tax=Arthrobotrys musiformis TaxID=47236 RepID=A0AAV9WHF9_9PEZI
MPSDPGPGLTASELGPLRQSSRTTSTGHDLQVPSPQPRPAPAPDLPGRPPQLLQNPPEQVDYWKFIKEKKYWPWWVVLAVLVVLVVLMTVYHKDIVHWLQPVSARIRSLSWGWIIPVLILIALSFPPLFGHEIVIVLCGAVYGLWVGFGIVAAGTFTGEILTYFAFLTILRRKAESLEQKNLDYATLARITREGGFWAVFIVRISVVPGHFSTAVFAVCGVEFWAFALASFVTLPKQLTIIYLGVIIGNESGGRLVSSVVLGVTFLITVIAGIYILQKLKNTRKLIASEAQMLRGASMIEERSGGEGREQTTDATTEGHENRERTSPEALEAYAHGHREEEKP